MDQLKNTVVWVDVPVENLARAKKFYEFIFATKLEISTYENSSFVTFPHAECSVSGCIFEEKNFSPSSGVLIYLNADKRLDQILSEIKSHGGDIVSGKKKIGPWGYRAIILDSERNKIALHSME